MSLALHLRLNNQFLNFKIYTYFWHLDHKPTHPLTVKNCYFLSVYILARLLTFLESQTQAELNKDVDEDVEVEEDKNEDEDVEVEEEKDDN